MQVELVYGLHFLNTLPLIHLPAGERAKGEENRRISGLEVQNGADRRQPYRSGTPSVY